MPTATDIRDELTRVLTILAQPADEQISHLRSLDVIPSNPAGAEAWATVDDLALDFDAIAPAAYGREADGDFTAAELDAVRAVDLALSAMSGARNADLWTERALRDAPEWANVRVLARRALATFAHPERAPVFQGKPSSLPRRS